MDFKELKSRWNWSPIRNCPGRFILIEEDKTISPEDVIVAAIEFSEFQVEKAKDTVVVGRIIDSGMISY